MASGASPANDALLVQLARGALGRRGLMRGSSRINVSSCKLVVTLHGITSGTEEREEIEAAVRTVPGFVMYPTSWGGAGSELPWRCFRTRLSGYLIFEAYSAKMEVVNGEQKEKGR